ncbi:MAG TPA: Dabb family protein [Ktedonobacteraceae bacterium]|nr:Dabb family protein [Ktedonobacteraceae bacterium]
MIRHLIVFNISEGVTREQCLAMAELGRQELSRIPGVISISFGEAIAENARYRYTFTIDLRDEEALRAYQGHPLHVAFANNHFRPVAPDRITTDYEVLY